MIQPLARYFAAALVTGLLAAGCAHQPAPSVADAPSCPPPAPCPSCPVCPAPAQPPAAAPVPPAPALQVGRWEELPGWKEDDPSAAWPALRHSCSSLRRQPPWQKVCEAVSDIGPAPSGSSARRFFEHHFVPWRVLNPDGSTTGLVTGYYEPLIRGSRTRSARSAWPIHGVPADMLTIELGDVHPELKHLRLRGRLIGNKVLPYWSREEFSARAEHIPAPVLLWADDPLDLFFLQVQGSGRVQLPDGSMVRVGYADQNGHPYQSIGRWLVAQGELNLDQASMEGIKRWARDNPQRLTALLNANPSYVFFRELPAADGGPLGALGVPLSAGRSIAVDPRYIPLGAPVFLASTYPLSERPLNRLVFAQDTGGAIKGGVRADFFWGFGPDAGREAGRMRQQGSMWVLLPKGMAPPKP